MSSLLPPGYVSLPEAAAIVEQALFSGVDEKPLVAHVRNRTGFDVGSGEEREAATAALWKAVDGDRLVVMAIGGKRSRIARLSSSDVQGIPLLRVPSVGNFAFLRAPNPLHSLLVERFGLNLSKIALAFSKNEVEHLARVLRRSRRKTLVGTRVPLGRPSGQPQVMEIIRGLVERKDWSFPASMKRLATLVNKQMLANVSDDTVSRALDELFAKTKDRRYERPRRRGHIGNPKTSR